MEKPGGSGTSSSSSVDPTTCSFNHNFLGKALHQKLRYLINYLISGKSEHKNFNIFYWTNTRTLSWNCSRNQHLDYLEPEPPQNITFDVKYRPPPPPGPGSASLSSSCMLTLKSLRFKLNWAACSGLLVLVRDVQCIWILNWKKLRKSLKHKVFLLLNVGFCCLNKIDICRFTISQYRTKSKIGKPSVTSLAF